MYPLHIGVLDMRDATLPLCTITATTLLWFWQGRIKILNISPVNVIYSNDENNKYLYLHENKECMVLHNTLLHNIIILIIFNIA